MNSNIIEDIAQTIHDQASKKTPDNQFGSVILTVMIIGIIVNLIRVSQECNKKNTKNMNREDKFGTNIQFIKDKCTNRNWFTKMKIKKIIRENIGSTYYKQYGNLLLDAILTTGENLTDDKLIQLLEIYDV